MKDCKESQDVDAGGEKEEEDGTKAVSQFVYAAEEWLARIAFIQQSQQDACANVCIAVLAACRWA